MTYLLPIVIATPFVVFCLLGTLWLSGVALSEKAIVAITHAGLFVSTICLARLLPSFFTGGTRFHSADWFRVGEYHFSIELELSRLATFPSLLAVLLLGLITHFSSRYIHRDRGFLRFFLMLNLFASGILTVFIGGALDVMLVGWELVGISSVFLIAFFQEREQPVAGALRAFITYRTCDIGLLVAIVLMHRFTGNASLEDISKLTSQQATLVACLLVLASLGKSAQFPFSGWLPKAMEGPTPSSAAFYGALSIHAGAFLLLKARHLLEMSPATCWGIVIIGAATTLQATLSSRAAADAKSALALGAQAQVGLIFIEIGLGWDKLALWHLCAHSVLRTLEFLRAPSTLHTYHSMHAAAGGHIPATGQFYNRFIPESLRLMLYRVALDHGWVDTVLYRFILGSLIAVVNIILTAEQRMAPIQEKGLQDD